MLKRLKNILRRRRYKKMSRQQVFMDIYARNTWGNAESRSGPGSTDAQTTQLRRQIESLLKEYEITSILDLACGDFNWMRRVNLGSMKYTGADIVPDLIAHNQRRFGSTTCQFILVDIVDGKLPKADLVLCRDVFVHLPQTDILNALDNIRQSGARWLLATTFPGAANHDIEAGQWRLMDLCAPPYSLPPPVHSIPEQIDFDYPGPEKQLALWRISALQAPD